jgi:hypothetical protein
MYFFGKKKSAPKATGATAVSPPAAPSPITSDTDALLAQAQAVLAESNAILAREQAVSNQLGTDWNKMSPAEQELLEQELAELEAQSGRARGGEAGDIVELRNMLKNTIAAHKSIARSPQTPNVVKHRKQLYRLAREIIAHIQTLKSGAKRKRSTRRKRTRSTRRKRVQRSS